MAFRLNQDPEKLPFSNDDGWRTSLGNFSIDSYRLYGSAGPLLWSVKPTYCFGKIVTSSDGSLLSHLNGFRVGERVKSNLRPLTRDAGGYRLGKSYVVPTRLQTAPVSLSGRKGRQALRSIGCPSP